MTTVSSGQNQQLGQEQIKVVQGAGGQQIAQQGLKIMTSKAGATTAMIGGQTVRLASPGGTLLIPGTEITGPAGKQIILQIQGPGGGKPQIVTSQGTQVDTIPKGQQQVVAGQGQRIVQAGPGEQIPQGATIVKGQGQPGETTWQSWNYKSAQFLFSSCPSLFLNESVLFSVESVSDCNFPSDQGLNYWSGYFV